MNFSLKSSILTAIVLSLVASGCYYNPPVDRDAKDKKNKTDDQETFAATFNPCEGDSPPAKCTASPDDPAAWGPAFIINFMVFDSYGTFPKVASPISSAYSSYFDKLGSDDYRVVFEVVGFDENRANERQDVYIDIWAGGTETKAGVKVKKSWLWFGNFSKSRLKGTIWKSGVVYNLEAENQTIELPLSSQSGSAPKIVFKDATLGFGLEWFPDENTFSLNGGSISGILTKESYQKSLVWSALSCGETCIKKTSPTTCKPGKDIQRCPLNCGSALQYCVQGPSLLNTGFTTTVDGEAYAGATAQLSVIGGGTKILGTEEAIF